MTTGLPVKTRVFAGKPNIYVIEINILQKNKK